MKLSRCWVCALLLLSSYKTYAQVPGSAVDVQHYNFDIGLNDESNLIKGKAAISIKLLKSTKQVTFDLLAKDATGKGMVVSSVTEKGKKLRFKQSGEAVTILSPAKAQSTHTYVISYSGIPADGLIISTNKYGDRTFFGDNWLRRAHKWLPCVDNVADKAKVDFVVTAPAYYNVVANGLLIKESTTGSVKLTHWSEKTPISTKLMVVGVARFAIERSGTVKGIPVYTYVFPQDKENGFKAYKCAAEILPVFIDKVGPFAYGKLANVQSKTIFGGMENASAIFYYENSVNDKAIEALVAHEIGHQWFGDAATENNLDNVWLSEGFATYMAHYFHEHKYGTDSLKKRMAEDRRAIFAFEKQRKTPVVDTTKAADPMEILNTNSYQKGSWVLHMLRQKLGDEVFWKGIRAYYAKYMNRNVSTVDLRTVMEQTSGQDLQQFFKQWLYTFGHPKIKIGWQVDKTNHGLHLHIEQLQDIPYALNFNMMIGDKPFTVEMKQQAVDLNIAAVDDSPAIVADPDGKLLAEFEIAEIK